MLSKADDYPIHQTPDPIAFSGTDRNFYDRYFFNGISNDAPRQQLVRCMLSVAQSLGTPVLAEGIETTTGKDVAGIIIQHLEKNGGPNMTRTKGKG